MVAKKKATKKKVAKKKPARKSKPKQQELKGMPERDEVGVAAVEYLAARAAVQDAKESAADAAAKLTGLLRKKRRKEIKIEGVCITAQQTEAQFVLKVKKVKQ